MSQQHNDINENINVNAHGDRHNRDENQPRDLEDLVFASVMLPIARANLLDYLYASGIPLRPMQLGGGGGAIDMDGVASILANSLYDRRPVKTVVNDEAMAELPEKIFTAQLAEELKINTVCGIWQDDFEEGERIRILPCNHAFKVDAIDKWLTTEKAECPMCRFPLSSKEVNCGDISSNIVDEYHVRGGGGEAMVVDDAPEDDRLQQNLPQINENHIAARLADNIHNRLHRDDPVRAVYAGAYASRQSISVPINQLLQSRRNMINNIARVSGGARGGLRFPPVAAAAAPPAPPAHEPEPEVAVAHDIPIAPVAADINNNYPYINNIYYVQNIINNNHPDAERGDNGEHYANINNYYYDQYDNNISNRERDDIEEAIRRSLQEQ